MRNTALHSGIYEIIAVSKVNAEKPAFAAADYVLGGR